MTLTARQQAFVEHYVTHGCGGRAAELAGYSKKTRYEMAYENLRKPQIIAAIAAKQAEIVEKIEIDREVVMGGILGAVALARSRSDPGAMLSGYASLARMLGFDKPEAKSKAPRVETDAVRAKYEAMSDEELQRLVDAGKSKSPA